MNGDMIHIQLPAENLEIVKQAFEESDIRYAGPGVFGTVVNVAASDEALTVAQDLLEKGTVTSVEDSRDRAPADASAPAEPPLETASFDGPA